MTLMKRYRTWRRRQITDKIARITRMIESEHVPEDRKVTLFWRRNRLYTRLKEIA